MKPLRFTTTFRRDEDPEIYDLLASLSGRARARKVRFLVRKALGLANEDIADPTTPRSILEMKNAETPTAESTAPRTLGGGLARLGVDPSQFRFTSS